MFMYGFTAFGAQITYWECLATSSLMWKNWGRRLQPHLLCVLINVLGNTSPQSNSNKQRKENNCKMCLKEFLLVLILYVLAFFDMGKASQLETHIGCFSQWHICCWVTGKWQESPYTPLLTGSSEASVTLQWHCCLILLSYFKPLTNSCCWSRSVTGNQEGPLGK